MDRLIENYESCFDSEFTQKGTGGKTNQLNQYIEVKIYLQLIRSRCKEYWYGSVSLADRRQRRTSLTQVGTGEQSSCYLLTNNTETVTDGG